MSEEQKNGPTIESFSSWEFYSEEDWIKKLGSWPHVARDIARAVIITDENERPAALMPIMERYKEATSTDPDAEFPSQLVTDLLSLSGGAQERLMNAISKWESFGDLPPGYQDY